jgi:hypothetical protein
MANGASTGDGVPGTRKTKVSMLLREGRDGLHRLLMDSGIPDYNAYIKSERKKNRGTVAAMDSMWVQMAFVFPGLLKAIDSLFPTSLSGLKLNDWLTWASRMRSGTVVAMPIDQSKFDHIPTSGEVADIVEWMVSQARTMPGWSNEQGLVAEILLYRLRQGGTITYKSGNRTRRAQVRHGVLSGWYITAGLDTVLNGLEYVAICQRSQVTPALKREEVCFQGDDINKVGGNYHENCRIAEEYGAVLNVHPSKFYIDTGRGEYLRNCFGWDHQQNLPFRRGYVARSIPSMLYAQRWSQGMMNARSIVNSWSDLASRSGNTAACREHCRRDLFGYFKTKVSMRTIDDWLSTPTPAGGAGVLPYRMGQRMVSCTEQALGLKKNEYESGLFKTELQDLPPTARHQARKFGIQISQKIPALQQVAPTAVVDTLVGATHLKNKKPQPDQELLDGLPIEFTECGGNRVVPPRPNIKIDPMYSSPALRQMARDRNLDGILSLIDPGDVDRVKRYHKLWSRNVWISWLLGELPSDNLSSFGTANDVCSHVKVQMLWPAGKVTMARVRGCAAAAVMRSRAKLGACRHLREMRA